MTWWSWTGIGFLLLVAEVLLPTGFFLFLFGLAAIIVGILLGIGLPMSINTQMVLFGVLSIGLALTLAKRLRMWFSAKGQTSNSNVVGSEVILTSAISPGEEGNGDLWGAAWKVKNIGATYLAAGTKCKVVEVSGVTLQVK